MDQGINKKQILNTWKQPEEYLCNIGDITKYPQHVCVQAATDTTYAADKARLTPDFVL